MKVLRTMGGCLLLGICLLFSPALVGCDGDDDTVFLSRLTGLQEAPVPVDTNASGTGSVTIPDDEQFIDATISTTDFETDVAAAHIHFGRPGEAGPILFTFDEAPTATFPGTISQRFTAADLEDQDVIDTFQEAIDAIREGNAYLNVHTTEHPDGEIRGQIGGERFVVNLDPVDTGATFDGNAEVIINESRTVIGVGLITDNVPSTDVTIEVRNDSPEGDLLFTVFDAVLYPGFASVSLDATDFAEPIGSPIENFGDAIDAIENEDTFLIVRTDDIPEGIILSGRIEESIP